MAGMQGLEPQIIFIAAVLRLQNLVHRVVHLLLMAFALSCLQLLHQLVLHRLILFLQISFTDEIHGRLRVMLRRLH